MVSGSVTLDTLSLNVRYPHSDIYEQWYVFAKGVDKHFLKRGIAVDNFVVRTGMSGYKLSVWQHDARVLLTDETDAKRGEGKGMGITIQLGPRYLTHHITELNSAVRGLLAEIGVRGNWPINITRLDLALDIFNVAMRDQNIQDWRQHWVGRSKLSAIYFNSRTGALETLNIGVRSSPIYLRIYDKLEQATKEGDIDYWLDIWKQEDPEAVTRVEWEIKPKKGNFSEDLIDFDKFNGFSRRELMNYLIEWGRLCIPGDDNNKSRWESAPFWKDVETIANEWADGVTWPTSRYGKTFKGVSEMYLKQLSGHISGGVARLGGEKLSIATMFEEMENNGEGLSHIQDKARVKANVINKL